LHHHGKFEDLDFEKCNNILTQEIKSIMLATKTKLQKAMGHSSLNVSLTYLRGLEVAELKEEDMPMV